jgi:hypothetical protein
MTAAPPLPRLKRVGKRTTAPGGARPSPPTAWTSQSAQPIEIVAHDRYSTALLLEHAAPLFPVEIVSGTAWIVRLQPPAGEGWVLELLALVERWLESARLPCAKLVYGGRSYLVRAAPAAARARAAAEASHASPDPAVG